VAIAPERRPIASAPRIRSLRKEDVEAIQQILRESLEAAAWSNAALEELVSQQGALALVIEERSLVSGFIAARQIADEAEILNLAIAPWARRSGQGTALLDAALKEFGHRHVARVFLEVRESNAGAIAFYRKQGFTPTGRRPAYYQDPDEDALCMEAKLAT
jgi:[ribosomal protein S18]-alanine N-acetyltransferase